MLPPHPQTLDEYLARFDSREITEEIVRRTGEESDRVAEMLHRYGAEARYGYSQIMPQLPHGGRILEIGSGLGMLSGYLKLQGYDIMPLEPCANGFGMLTRMLSVLIEKHLSPPALSIKAEELSPEKHGRFDVIFSVNVLEHIANLEGAIAGMLAVLAEGGHMWHTCPNYTVPYEPHFSVPLIPFFPRATRWLLPEKITGSDLWRSVNFVTVAQMRRIAAAQSCAMTFRRGTMAQALRRLESDPQFAARHKGWPAAVYRILKATGLLKLVEALPPALNTPMAIELRRA